MSKWKPVFLFQLDFQKIGIYAAIGILFTVFALLVHRCSNPVEPVVIQTASVYEQVIGMTASDQKVTTILYDSRIPQGMHWTVRYQIITNDWHPTGFVKLTFIDIVREGFSQWWWITKSDPSGLIAIGVTKEGHKEVNLDNEYFRGAYRTAEAIVCAYQQMNGSVRMQLIGGNWVDPHLVVQAKHRMEERWQTNSN